MILWVDWEKGEALEHSVGDVGRVTVDRRQWWKIVANHELCFTDLAAIYRTKEPNS